MTAICGISPEQYLAYLKANTDKKVEQLDLKLPRAELTCLAIKDGDAIVSVVSYFKIGTVTRIKGLHTKKEYRGRGYGSELLREVSRLGGTLDTFASHYSHGLFLKLGFVDQRVIHHPKGDVYYMRRNSQ